MTNGGRPLEFAPEAPGDGGLADGLDPAEFDEGTVVIVRGDATVDEGTVVIDRGAVDADAVDEGTLVIDRRGGTVVGSDVDDGTVVIDRGPVDDGTVVIERAGGAPVGAAAVREPAPAAATRMQGAGRRARALRPAPVDLGSVRRSERASGPGVVSAYAPRARGTAPVSPPAILRAAESTRVPDPALPSLAKRSRRSAIAALTAFGLVCAAAVAGAATIVVLAIGR